MKRVKLQLDRKRYAWIEIEDDKLPQIEEMNREVWRTAKRESRHESLYSLEAMAESSGVEIPDPSPTAEERLVEQDTDRERKARLHRALASLTPRQREMVRMVYFEGRSQDEVAAYNGITKSAVSHAMERIYTGLKKVLEKD